MAMEKPGNFEVLMKALCSSVPSDPAFVLEVHRDLLKARLRYFSVRIAYLLRDPPPPQLKIPIYSFFGRALRSGLTVFVKRFARACCPNLSVISGVQNHGSHFRTPCARRELPSGASSQYLPFK